MRTEDVRRHALALADEELGTKEPSPVDRMEFRNDEVGRVADVVKDADDRQELAFIATQVSQHRRASNVPDLWCSAWIPRPVVEGSWFGLSDYRWPMLRVTQFSDLHVSPPGYRGYGGLAPDTGETFAAVLEHAFSGGRGSDITVVTGDIADRGQPEEYEIAAERLASIPTPTTILPGNHDFHAPFQSRLAARSVSMNRAETHGPWLFVYLDSNADGRTPDDVGRLVDDEDRIRSNGGLGAAEIAWVDELLGASNAEHVWLWVHHAPAATGMFLQPSFTAEIEELIGRHPRVRGIAAGHTHTNERPTIADRPVHICPSLTLNFDIEEWTTLPPGYRTYEFRDDGTVNTTLYLHDDERWPRLPVPEPAIQYIQGQLSWEEMQTKLGIDLSH